MLLGKQYISLLNIAWHYFNFTSLRQRRGFNYRDSVCKNGNYCKNLTLLGVAGGAEHKLSGIAYP